MSTSGVTSLADTSPSEDGARPKGSLFSIVVNTCDRRDPLRLLLHALDHQTYPHFEVVVVVGPTRDDTLRMLEEDFQDRLVVVRCPHFNLSVSRNLGLQAARGEIVAFVDDDAIPCPTWLEQLADRYRQKPALAAIGGRTYNVQTGQLQFLSGFVSSFASQQDVREPDSLLPSLTTPDRWFPRLHGCNMSYRRQALIDVGGFDERYEYLFDDSDIAVRLAKIGARVEPIEDAVVYHAPSTGRNRGKAAYDINWYCWIKATLYFTIKNGDGSLFARLGQALRHLRRFYSDLFIIAENGDLEGPLLARTRSMLRRGAWDGFYQGLLRSRRLPSLTTPATRPPLPFPDRQRLRPAITPSTDLDHQVSLRRDRQPMRIALLSAEFPPRSQHGIARHTEALARALARRGNEIHVVTLGDDERSISRDGFYVHHVPLIERKRYQPLRPLGFDDLVCWLGYSHAAFDKVEDLIVNHRLQLVDSPLWNLDGLVTSVSGTIPVSIRIASAMRLIADVHGHVSAETRLLGELEERFLGLAAGFVANSGASVDALRTLYGVPEDERPLTLVPHGIAAQPENLVEDLGSRSNQDVLVLFVGRLEGRKGVPELFEVIPRVVREHPRSRFAFVGADNSREDGFLQRTGHSYVDFFRKKHPRLTDRVLFLGHVSDTELEEWYRRCDVFVAPSRYESFGLVYLEAMNHARPVIAVRAGGPTEIVVDGETGLLVEPDDTASLAKALSRLVGDEEERRRMGRAGRTRLLERYSDEAMARAFEEHYQKILEAEEQTR